MKPLLIIGSSKSWEEDFVKAADLIEDYDVCCVNKAVFKIPCIILGYPDYYYSYHQEYQDYVDEGLVKMKLTCAQPLVGALHCPLEVKRAADWAGSSGLQATKVAIKYWKYDKIILCGIALDPPYDTIFYRAWAKAFKILDGVVKSMSGKTKELLGLPTKEWVNV